MVGGRMGGMGRIKVRRLDRMTPLSDRRIDGRDA
jgi:hypothetical protein